MDANTIIQRIGELEKLVEQSAAQHNSLVGRLLELRDMLTRMADTGAETPNGITTDLFSEEVPCSEDIQ